MLRSSIKNNIKTILRDPTTVLALIAAVLMMYLYGLNVQINELDVDPLGYGAYDFVANKLMGAILRPVGYLAYPFVAIVVAVNIFKDKRTDMRDVAFSSQLSYNTYFFGKLLSYYLVGLGMCLVITLSYDILFCFRFHPLQADVDWGRMLLMLLTCRLTAYLFCLPLPIGFALFLTGLTGVPATGVIFNCAYNYLGAMFFWFDSSWVAFYAYRIPVKLEIYLKYWVLHIGEPLSTLIGNPNSALVADYHSSFSQALTSVCALFVISAALISASYLLLKRRFAKV